MRQNLKIVPTLEWLVYIRPELKRPVLLNNVLYSFVRRGPCRALLGKSGTEPSAHLFILQALFQSAQPIYKKREGSESGIRIRTSE